MRRFQTHGTGAFELDQLGARGAHLVIEPGVLVFRPEHVRLGDNVYLGHGTLLKAYPSGGIEIGDDCWLGPYCQLSGKARITIGDGVGIGPGVQILTSAHEDPGGDDTGSGDDTGLADDTGGPGPGARDTAVHTSESGGRPPGGDLTACGCGSSSGLGGGLLLAALLPLVRRRP